MSDGHIVRGMHIPVKHGRKVADELGILVFVDELIDQIRLGDAPVVSGCLLDVLPQEDLRHPADDVAEGFDGVAFAGHADLRRYLPLDDHRGVDAVAGAFIPVVVIDVHGALGLRGEQGGRMVVADAGPVCTRDDHAMRVEQVDLVAQHVLDVGHDRLGDMLVNLHVVASSLVCFWYMYHFATGTHPVSCSVEHCRKSLKG